MNEGVFDVIIAGAGPSGAACAIALADKGISVALIEKDSFPREKVCGDAISLDTLKNLRQISERAYQTLLSFSEKRSIKGIRLFAPNGKDLTLDYSAILMDQSAGYVIQRIHFDNILIEEVRKHNHIAFFEKTTVISAKTGNEGVVVETSEGRIEGKFLVVSSGENSDLLKSLQGTKRDPMHHSISMRAYFKGVEGTADDLIDLCFFREILPGYVWVFPMEKGIYNVGIGLLSSFQRKKKQNMKKLLENYLKGDSYLAPRFKNAEQISEYKGAGIPLGSRRVKLFGQRYIITGDAAHLVDPLTGEGMFPALASGKLAASHIEKVFSSENFNVTFGEEYKKAIESEIFPSLKRNYRIQKLVRRKGPFNFIASKAHKMNRKTYRLSGRNDEARIMRKLVNPLTYLRLIFR